MTDNTIRNGGKSGTTPEGQVSSPKKTGYYSGVLAQLAGLEEHNQNEGKNYFCGRIDPDPAASADGRGLPGGSELGMADLGAVSVPVKIKEYLMEISRRVWYNHAKHRREVTF